MPIGARIAMMGRASARKQAQDVPTISNVKARQRYPWNGLVDITCLVSGIDETSDVKFALSAVMPDSGSTNKISHVYVVQGGTNSTNLAVSTNGSYRLLWDANADLGQVRYTNMVVSVTLENTHEKVQLWEGGPYWATTNLGAEKPEDYGYYFWWGDTVGYKRENDKWVASDGESSNFSFSDESTCKSIFALKSEGWITADNILAPEHDVVHVQWGGIWRMPTKDELTTLNDNCDWTWTTVNGVNGYIVRGRGDCSLASIFLPCAGYGRGTSLYNAGSYGAYWSSVPYSDGSGAWHLGFDSSNHGTYNGGRDYGQSVRPVQGFAEAQTIMGGKVGDSAPFRLDTRTGVRESGGVETLTYSSLWDGGVDATVTIAQDGVALVEGLTGEGERVWNVQKAGTYVLTHTTYTNGVAGKVETATFKLTKDIESLTVGDIAQVIYTGSAIVPNPVVTDNACGYTLVKDTDYTLSYANNVNVGTATVTVTGKGNYTGTTNYTFEIARRNIADAVVTLGGGLTYNGQVQSQSVSSVNAGGLAVTYTVSGNKATDVGNYTLTVTGTGNFTGTATKQFAIARKLIAGATVTLGSALVYTGSAQSQNVSGVKIDGLNATFSVSGNSVTAVGNYTLTVTGTGNFTGSTTKQFTVAPKPLTAAMVGDVGNVTYTGSAHTPEPVVTDAARGVILAKGTDYTLSCANNKDAGTATVTVTGQGNYSGAISKNFTIAKQTVVLPTIASKTYNGELQTATVASSTLYDIVQNAGGVDVGQYDVKLRLVDSTNYAWSGATGADKIVKFAITKATNAWIAEPSISGWTYGQPASSPNMGLAKFGTTSVSYGASGSMPPSVPGGYTATFTVAGTENYTGLTKDVPFTITPYKEAKLKEIFDGLPVIVRSDDEDVWKVTLTNDVWDLRLPDDIGLLILDLNGFSVTGTSVHLEMLTNTGWYDANPAISIYHSEVGTNATCLDILNSGDDGGIVTGGTYLDVDLRQMGKDGISVASDANAETRIRVREGVSVYGGMGGYGSEVLAGWSGNGISGNVEINEGIIGSLGDRIEEEDNLPSEIRARSGVRGNVWLNVGSIIGGVSGVLGNECASIGSDLPQDELRDAALRNANATNIVYDGMYHSIRVPTYTQFKSSVMYSLSRSGPFMSECPQFTGPTNIVIWYVHSSEIYSPSFVTNVAMMSIGERAISSVVVGGISAQEFTGSALTPKPVVTDAIRGVTLVEGEDYTLSYTNNTVAGTATVTVTGKGYYTGSKVESFLIAPKPLTATMVGAVGNVVTYTGTAFTPEPTVMDTVRGVTLVDGADYTLSYANNVNVGTATVTVNGKGNYTGNITKNFTIDKAEVTPPTIASKAYTGGLLRADVSATERYTVQNDGGVNVGGYPVTLTLTDSANYRWKDGDSSPLSLTFTVTKASNSWITRPSIANWTYGQAASLPNMGAAKFGMATVTYGAMGTSRPTDAGNYTATFTVAGTANYSGLSKPVPFTIAKATYNMGSARWDYVGAFTYDGSVKTVGVSGLPLGVTVSSYSGNTAILSGTYTAHATFAYDTVNYNEPELADLVWEIKLGDQSKIEDVFEDLPVTIGPDGAGGWTVKLTNDVDSADLPLEIPDNLGQVTLDLNGHDLVGANGRAAARPSQDPGEDGKPAIRIVPGEGGGDVTRLTLVTTGGDSLVKGGDGGVGNPGGNGAPGIEVADGAQGGVKFDVGMRVTVRGGDGGASETGRGGDGGAGIDGNVGTNDGTIIGGNGGDSVSGDGGNGGMGGTGDVGTNNGTISGGTGGVSAQGENGDDGIAVGGTIGGGTGTVRKVKVAVPEVPSAAYTGEAVEPQVPASALYAVSASGGTQSGSYPVMLTLLDFANYEWIPREGATINGALAVVNFVILKPPPAITVDDGGQSGAANSASYVGVYDGEGHGISVRVTYPATGYSIRYATAANGPFTDDVPLFTDVVTGAETWYEVSAAGFDPVTNVAVVTITPRNLSGAALGSLRFTGTGGARTPVATLVDDLGHEVPPADYVFVWTEEASGALSLSFTGRRNYLGLFETRLAQTRFTVTFDTNGGVFGEGVETTAQYDIGTYYGVLPVPTRAGYLFDGWYEHADFSGSPVTRNTEVIAQDVTLHAKWVRRVLWYTDAPFHLESAATYNGYLIDPQAADVVVGSISVKAGKPGRNGLSKVSVTVLLAGKKKATLKGSTIDGKVSGTVGGMALDLTLGFASMSGTLGRYTIDGARNVFSAKDADTKLKAAQALNRWQGTYVVAWQGAAGWNGLSLDVKAKGKVKVAGVLADGTKVSASSQLLVGERECALAVSYTKKAASVACLVWLCEDGSVECGNMRGGASALIANARSGARLAAGAAFRMGSDTLAGAVPGLLADLLPDGQEVRMKGSAFDIDKAGKAKLLKDKSGVDPSGLGTNPSGLKLKYTMKNGTFKGTFSAYAFDGGRLKKVKVQVSGVVLGGKGYGTASVKKPLVSWPVEIR